MNDQIIQVKVGQSINWTGKWSVNGEPQDLDDFEIICQMRDSLGTLFLDLDVSVLDQAKRRGCYELEATASDTALMKPGVYECDVRYRNLDSDQVEYSESFLVEFVGSMSKVS